MSPAAAATFALLALSAAARAAHAAQPEPPIVLWPDSAPGAAGSDPDLDVPTLTPYRPETPAPTGTSVVILPGGGYSHLASDHEGKQVAEFFNRLGITAFVLKYRLGPRYHHPAMLDDAQRAIRYVRAHAAEYGLHPDRIGIMGFSAGGHLATTAATHFDPGRPQAADPIDRESARPDFLIAGYPVVSLIERWTHESSRDHLLGEHPSQQQLAELSNERHVTEATPPTFLFHTDADADVPAENSVMFYLALRRAAVPAELHIYEQGSHGLGLAPHDPVLSSWSERLTDWLRVRQLL